MYDLSTVIEAAFVAATLGTCFGVVLMEVVAGGARKPDPNPKYSPDWDSYQSSADQVSEINRRTGAARD